MKDQAFSKDERLLRRPQFRQVLDHGRKLRVDRYCLLFFLPNGTNQKRLGIIASKKVGNAVARNRAKRIIREVFRRNKERFQDGMDVVVVSGKPLPRIPMPELEQALLSCLPRQA